VCIALCTTVAQKRPDHFPCYSPDSVHCSADVCLREGAASPLKAVSCQLQLLSAECVASDVLRVCVVSSEAGVVQFGARSSLRGALWPGTARAVVQVDPV